MGLFRWEKGRGGTGYYKLLLCRCAKVFKFDMYLIKFPCGSEITAHTDKLSKGNHFRFNFIIKKPEEGGEFTCSNMILNTERVKLFRPDIYEHRVSKIIKGNRLVFSLGWALNT